MKHTHMTDGSDIPVLLDTLPGCMMPDGGDACPEYRQLVAENELLRDDRDHLRSRAGIECGCGYDKQGDVCLCHLPVFFALRARVAELSSLLTEAVAEMEPDIESKYANVRDFPSMARKYEQDMDLPRRIRAALQEGE